MKKILILVLIFFILLTGCTNQNNNEDVIETPSDLSKEVVGKYRGGIYYEEEGTLKEYLYYTNELVFSLYDDNTCSNYVEDEFSKLTSGSDNPLNCIWELDGDNLTIQYSVGNHQFFFNSKYENESFFVETNVKDENFMWGFDKVNIKGIKFEKNKYTFEDLMLFTFGELYDYGDSLHGHDSSSGEPKRLIIEQGKISDPKELLNIKLDNYSYEVEGNIDFNTVGFYPVKFIYYREDQIIYKENKVIVIIPPEKETINWYDEHYVDLFMVDLNDAKNSSSYYIARDNSSKNVCIGLDDKLLRIVFLKNGAKCEELEYTGYYGDSRIPSGRYLYYDTITNRTKTFGEMYDFYISITNN